MKQFHVFLKGTTTPVTVIAARAMTTTMTYLHGESIRVIFSSDDKVVGEFKDIQGWIEVQ